MKVPRLTASESLMLDVIRVSAAMVVAFGHLTQGYFSTGWRDDTSFAQAAVVVFFILSGFVIRYVTVGKPATLPVYLGDRFSRVYSVAIPALLFTLLSDAIARRINPAFYATWLGDSTHPLQRILVNLAFCGQLWSLKYNALSNLPYWSVNYEFAYYLIYGLFFYLSGKRRWPLVVLACLTFGYHILLLFPLWIAGCLLYDLYRRWDAFLASRFFRLARLYALPVLALCALAPFLPLKSLLHVTPRVSAFARDQYITLANYLLAPLWMLLFVLFLRTARRWTIDPQAGWVKAVRFIAEGTFPIYLFHFPIYVLIAACIPYNHGSVPQKLLIFLSVVVVGILLGHPCNLLKLKIRSLLWRDKKPDANTRSTPSERAVTT